MYDVTSAQGSCDDKISVNLLHTYIHTRAHIHTHSHQHGVDTLIVHILELGCWCSAAFQSSCSDPPPLLLLRWQRSLICSCTFVPPFIQNVARFQYSCWLSCTVYFNLGTLNLGGAPPTNLVSQAWTGQHPGLVQWHLLVPSTTRG